MAWSTSTCAEAQARRERPRTCTHKNSTSRSVSFRLHSKVRPRSGPHPEKMQHDQVKHLVHTVAQNNAVEMQSPCSLRSNPGCTAVPEATTLKGPGRHKGAISAP
jgi:hypothetical protein